MAEKGYQDQIFKFKQFQISQQRSAMKVGTDGVLLGAWVQVEQANNILDIGAGTGVIAIMLAQRHPKAIVTGIEIDTAASEEATFNMSNCIWHDRLSLVNQPLQEFCQNRDKKFDLLVSNPPFFTGGVLSDSQDKAHVRHTVKLSHSDLLRCSRSLMHSDSRIAVILPYMEGLRFIELSDTFGFYPLRITEVYPKEDKGIERLLIELALKKPQSIEQSCIVIQKEARNDWTDEYRALLKDFYLNA